MSTSAQTDSFRSGRYLHQLLGGNHNGEMDQSDWYVDFKAQVIDRVRERREAKGLSHAQLGRRLRVQGTTVKLWEEHPWRFSFKHVERLCDILDVPWQQLIGLAPMPMREPAPDPLRELSGVVAEMSESLAKGTAEVVARLDAIERRLPDSTGQARPKVGGKPASGGQV